MLARITVKIKDTNFTFDHKITPEDLDKLTTRYIADLAADWVMSHSEFVGLEFVPEGIVLPPGDSETSKKIS